MSPDTVIAASDRASRLENELKKVIRGKDEIVRLALVSVLAHGHLLIEGVPGVGKTTLAQALGAVAGLQLSAGAVHQRHASVGHPGHLDLLGHRAEIRIQARPGFHQHSAGRRNQPHHAENSIRVARGHE